MRTLTKEQSQKTITKKMIRNILDGKLTNYAYQNKIKEAIENVYVEYVESGMMNYLETNWNRHMYAHTWEIENELRSMGLRMHGDA